MPRMVPCGQHPPAAIACPRRFADCMHLAEPGCAVTAADLERHEHYIKFLAEIKVRTWPCVCVCARVRACLLGETVVRVPCIPAGCHGAAPLAACCCRLPHWLGVAAPAACTADSLQRQPCDALQAREDYDVRVMQLAKSRREGAVKAKSGRGGETRYEARLSSKKHRTTSRRRQKQRVWDDAAADDHHEEDD